MYNGIGFDSKLKLILKPFPTKLYKNGIDNQCTVGNTNINAWQIKSKSK